VTEEGERKMLLGQIQNLNEYISHNQFMGVPLDIPAHLLVGAIMAVFLLKMTKNKRTILLLILSIALMKEAYDQEIMTNTLQENIKDTVVTMLIPLVIVFFQSIPLGRQIR
jgi:phosphatidylserine synthase